MSPSERLQLGSGPKMDSRSLTDCDSRPKIA
jgi:hypothetical protein